MRVFLYELITGGGLLANGASEPVPPSLSKEGAAMITALATDFDALEGVEVLALHDRRLDVPLPSACRTIEVADAQEEAARFAELAAAADWTVVIAPEFDGLLLQRCQLVEKLQGRLLSPHSELVRLAADKQATCEHLAAAGVPVPWGRVVSGIDGWPADVPYPAVLKPCDGAGSQRIRLLSEKGDRSNLCEAPFGPFRQIGPVPFFAGRWRLEQFCPGDPVSVSFLCGPSEHVALPPCRQHLSSDGRFRYLGGSCPLPHPMAARATRLARRAVDTLPACRGYLGVDLVLGPHADGRDDVVIEINPRMTTSYVGLRAISKTNLAAAMWNIAREKTSQLAYRFATPARPVQFDAGGRVWHQSDVLDVAIDRG